MTHTPVPWRSGRIGIPDALVGVTVAVLLSITPSHESSGQTPKSWPPLTVAFIADQGLGENARAVLRLIVAEGADLVLHQGDLDYQDDPSAWDAFITDILGADFPYFVSIGNNEVQRWYGANGYQDKLRARLHRIPEARCSGDLGVRSACTFRGLFFILSGIGTEPNEPDNADHVAYIREQLAQSNARWKVCSWHKNQTLMQVGGKGNEVGWAAYEACREEGAIVATGHTHNYSRTHLMDDFDRQSIVSTSNTLTIQKGKSFAFVSGLGGEADNPQPPWWSSIYPLAHGLKTWISSPKERSTQLSGRENSEWWASIYKDDSWQTKFGALFCTFFIGVAPNRAICYFKDVNGSIPDHFELINNDIGLYSR